MKQKARARSPAQRSVGDSAQASRGNWIGKPAFRLGWIAFMVAATVAPYLYAWVRTPSGSYYTWILPPYPEDSFSYMAWSRQAVHGALIFKIKYTAMPHAAFLFNPFFLICGWICALFSADMGIVFLLVKTAGVILFFCVLYKYTDYLGLSRTASVAAAVTAGISGGFGGVLKVTGLSGANVPSDLWIPELSTYWSLLWNPLFPFSLSLMVLSIYLVDRGTRERRGQDIWLSGLAAGGMALIHPYSVPLLALMAVVIICVRIRQDLTGYLCRFLATSIPLFSYTAWVTLSNAVLGPHSALGSMASPSVSAYLLGFGFPLIVIAVGVGLFGVKSLKIHWQLAAWFFLSVALAYFPCWFQRKMIMGAGIPLCILAGIAFGAIWDRFRAVDAGMPGRVLIMLVLLPLAASSMIYVVVAGEADVGRNQDAAYYLTEEAMKGLGFLKRNTKPDEIVFADYPVSRIIPAIVGNTVVWGHWAQSIDYDQRENWYKSLFSPQIDWNNQSRRDTFWGNDIQYIFADGNLKMDIEKNPSHWQIILAGADKIFENPAVIIYRRPEAL